MKMRWIMMLTFALGCLATGAVSGLAKEALRPVALQVRTSQEQATPSYSQRAQSALDLQDFQGGRQVIIATEYDVHILVGILVITAVVLLILLL